MFRFLGYCFTFICGFIIAMLIFRQNPPKKSFQKEQYQIINNSIENLSKLVVTRGSYAETYSFSDSKKYFYDVISFDKKAILSVTAKIEIGYDLSKMDIQIDSIVKQIIINKIPKEEITIIPNIKYFDLQESRFNSFNSDELNGLHQKATNNIKNAIETQQLKERAQKRLFKELSKIYQLSKLFNWKIVNNTQQELNYSEFKQ